MSDNVLMPEYLSSNDRSTELASQLGGWLKDDAQRAKRVEQLVALREKVVQLGASNCDSRIHSQRGFADPAPAHLVRTSYPACACKAAPAPMWSINGEASCYPLIVTAMLSRWMTS